MSNHHVSCVVGSLPFLSRSFIEVLSFSGCTAFAANTQSVGYQTRTKPCAVFSQPNKDRKAREDERKSIDQPWRGSARAHGTSFCRRLICPAQSPRAPTHQLILKSHTPNKISDFRVSCSLGVYSWGHHSKHGQQIACCTLQLNQLQEQ